MRSLARAALLCAPLLLYRTAAQSTACYNDEGVNVNNLNIAIADQYRPCNGVSGIPGPCCILNRSNPDLCLPNGLCQFNTVVNGKQDAQYYRNFCSDPTGKGCLSAKTVCPKTDDSKGIQLVPCGSSWNVTTKWCCGSDNSCCSNDKDPNLVTIQTSLAAVSATASSTTSSGGATQSTSTSTSTSTSASKSISTSTSTSTSTAAAADSSSSGISKGAIAGIAVGATIGGIALLVLLYLLVARSLKKKRHPTQPELTGQPHDAYRYEKPPQYIPGAENSQYQSPHPLSPPHQYPSPHDQSMQKPPLPPQELSDSRPVAELG